MPFTDEAVYALRSEYYHALWNNAAAGFGETALRAGFETLDEIGIPRDDEYETLIINTLVNTRQRMKDAARRAVDDMNNFWPRLTDYFPEKK